MLTTSNSARYRMYIGGDGIKEKSNGKEHEKRSSKRVIEDGRGSSGEDEESEKEVPSIERSC